MIGSSATDRDLTVQRPCDASLLPAGVVELADTPALGAGGFGRGGSNPSARMERSFRKAFRKVRCAFRLQIKAFSSVVPDSDGARKVLPSEVPAFRKVWRR